MPNTTINTAALPAMNQIVLEKLKFGIRKVLSPTYLLDSFTVEQHYDPIIDSLVVEVRGWVLAQKLEEHKEDVNFTATFQTPATWWQMFKRDHFPRWLAERFPVCYADESRTQTKTVTFARYVTYPEANIALPKETFGFPVYKTTSYQEDRDEA